MTKKTIKKEIKKPITKKVKVEKKTKLLKADCINLTLNIVELRKIFKKLSIAISTNPTRPYLSYVLFEKKGSEINFIATDGHKMVVIDIKTILENALDIYEDFSFMIPRVAILDFIKPYKGTLKTCNIVLDSDFITFDFFEFKRIYKMGGNNFPDWRKVIPTKIEPRVTFNPIYLKQMCSNLTATDDIVFYSTLEGGGHAPHIIKDDKDTTFIVMPRYRKNEK